MTNAGVGGLRRLGRYHLAEPLGGGPTGEVFRAKVYGVAGFERQFAVKRFHTQFVIDPETAAAVSAAARAYGSLEHPRIARLHEYGVAQGHTFTATEMVLGLDLARLVALTFDAGEPLVAGAAAAVISQAARAIGYAHGRGICHLGVCPTNLICTAEGEVKVTDFGFLPPRLPPRPAEDPSLAARVSYLAPEQLVGESTSAATDVYQLGVVAHELFTGARCFSGGTPLDIAQAILSGQLSEPQLPKPLLKVLRRSVARSPFERFPDAGAFADAFDAAVRVTPLPGGSRDVAGIVRHAMQRLAEMNENQVSGALSFPLPAPPRAPTPQPQPQVTTQQRTPPPAVPSEPPSISQLLSQAPKSHGLRKTLIGIGDEDSLVPSSDPDDDRVTMVREREMGFVKVSKPPPIGPARAAAAGEASFDDDKTFPAADIRGRVADTEHDVDLIHSMSEIDVEEIHDAPAQEISSPPARAKSNPPLPPPVPTPMPMQAVSPPIPPPGPPPGPPPEPPPPPGPEVSATPEVESIVVEMPQPPSGGGRAESTAEPMAVLHAEVSIQEPKKRRGVPRALLGLLAVAAIGGGGFLVYNQFFANNGSGKQQGSAAKASDGKTPVATSAGVDAGRVASRKANDAVPKARAKPDAGVPDAVPPDAAPKPDKLIVRSTPDGAKVYIDGSYKGETPQTIEASEDSHRLALIKAGYKLLTKEIAGAGKVSEKLEQVTPPGGPAGIKVRCKHKNRYYVNVDGYDVGQLCPTERIGVRMGKHVVEIYDPVTEARRRFRVRVKQTRNSLRVYVD